MRGLRFIDAYLPSTVLVYLNSCTNLELGHLTFMWYLLMTHNLFIITADVTESWMQEMELCIKFQSILIIQDITVSSISPFWCAVLLFCLRYLFPSFSEKKKKNSIDQRVTHMDSCLYIQIFMDNWYYILWHCLWLFFFTLLVFLFIFLCQRKKKQL